VKFTFILDAKPGQLLKLSNKIYEAGCDDVLVGKADGEVYVDFDTDDFKVAGDMLNRVETACGVKVTGGIFFREKQ